MAVGVFGLLAVMVLGILVLGGIVLLVALLANPKTRSAGIVLLLIVGLVVLVGGLLVGGLLSFRHGSQVQVESLQRQAERVRIEAMQQAEMARIEAMQQSEAFRSRGGPTPVFPQSPSSPQYALPDSTTRQDAMWEGFFPPAGAEGIVPVGEPDAADAEAVAEVATTAAPDTAAAAEIPAPAETAPPAEPEARPAWVDQPPRWVGDIYQMTLKTDPRLSRDECLRDLPAAVNEAVRIFAESQQAWSPQVTQRLRMQSIQSNLVAETWLEPVAVTLPGEWVRLHALLKFDQDDKWAIAKQCEAIRRQLDQQQAGAVVTSRLWYGGTGLATVVMLLGVTFACLKADLSTGGSCRGRICLGGGAALLLVAGLATLAVLAGPHPIQGGVADGPASAAAPSATDRLAMVPIAVPALILGAAAGMALLAHKKTRVVGLLLLGLAAIGGLVVLA